MAKPSGFKGKNWEGATKGVRKSMVHGCYKPLSLKDWRRKSAKTIFFATDQGGTTGKRLFQKFVTATREMENYNKIPLITWSYTKKSWGGVGGGGLGGCCGLIRTMQLRFGKKTQNHFRKERRNNPQAKNFN